MFATPKNARQRGPWKRGIGWYRFSQGRRTQRDQRPTLPDLFRHKTAGIYPNSVPAEEIESTLKDQIAADNQGKETIRKVFVHLNRVWLQPPIYCTALRDDALEMFRKRPDEASAFLLIWGMCIAAYPFIGHVAEATGRLLRLQGAAQAAQINVRLRERFGDRHFVHRSARYNLSTFLEAGALKEGIKRGVYLRGHVMKPRDDRETAWLVEALLHVQDETTLPQGERDSAQRVAVGSTTKP